MEATLTPTEIDEWRAYAEVEPFGPPGDDNRFQALVSTIWATNASDGARQPEWVNRLLDRIPNETARVRARIEQEQSEAEIEAFFSGRLATDES